MALNINDIILDGKTSDPISPVDGEMWFRSDINEWRFRKNGQTKKLASKKTSASEEDVAQCKCDATTAPVGTNDSSEGYVVGSHWIDITADKAYICVDATATSAIWIEVTQTGGGGAPQSYEAEGTSYITYGTTAYNVIPSMTITPPAGTYQVIFSSSGNLSLATSLCLIAIHVDGVIKTSTVRDFFIDDVKQQDMDTALLSTGIVTVNGSEAIDVRWYHSGPGVITMYERTLNLIKVTP